MSRRTLSFSIFALAISLGCARLGLWQVSRLHERQQRNALILGRLDAPTMNLTALAGDTAVRFRHALANGRYDYAHELVYAIRPRDGSPGVNILTPLFGAAGDTAVLVNRGWVYSPDGKTVDLKPWRESDSAQVDGFVEQFVKSDVPVTMPDGPGVVRRLDYDSLKTRFPFPIYPRILVQQAGRGQEAEHNTPVRVDPPPLSEGPHRSYAIQWFGFAITGIVGTVLVISRDRKREHDHSLAPDATPGVDSIS